MATTTRLVYREGFSRSIGDFISVVTTADGDAAFETIISSAFLGLDGGTDDDSYEDWYALIADSTSSADGESRRIVAYVPDPDAPTIRVASAFSVTIESGVTIELHRYNPVDKHDVLGRAINQLSRDLALDVTDESIVVDNVLLNTGFETFSSGFTNWTEVGSPAVTQETTIVRHGDSSAKVVASGAAGQLTQAPTINIDEITTETGKHERWVYSTEANAARLQIDYGSSIVSSSYHSGRDQWELLEVNKAVDTAATQAKGICDVADGKTGYFDIGGLSFGPVYNYDLPTSIVGDIYRLEQQRDKRITEGGYYPIRDHGVPFEGMILRLKGQGVLSVPTTDSGTTEIGEPQLQLLYAYAGMLLWQLFASPTRSAGLDRSGFDLAAKESADLVAVLKGQRGMVSPQMGAQRHRNNWIVQGNGYTRELVFTQPRT